MSRIYSVRQLREAVPEDKRARGLYLPLAGRSMGIRCCATKGTGKSRLFGRIVLWQDFLLGIPSIVLDPVGGLTNEFLDKLIRQPKERQMELSKRVRYVDAVGMMGKGDERYIVPMPLYTRETREETEYAIANRFLEIVGRIDPELHRNPTVGMNAVREVGSRIGMLLAALGWQLTEAETLLFHAERHREKIKAVATTAELQIVASYVLDDLPQVRKQQTDWEMKTGAFRRKLADVTLDPVLRAMYGADTPEIDWHAVVANQETVLIDLSRVEGRERVQFLMLHLYWSLIRHIKRRGEGKHHTPISLMIDEITFLLGDPKASQQLLADDLMELTDRISRSHNIWVTVIHQEMNQLADRVGDVFMRMGTQIFGSTSDPDAALKIARLYYPYEPHDVKAVNPKYDRGVVIDYQYDYYTMQEQLELHAREIMDREPFCFLVGVAERDGKPADRLIPFTIRDFEKGIYKDDTAVQTAKRKLMERDGVPIGRIAAQIRARTERGETPTATPTAAPGDAPFADAPAPQAGAGLRRRSRIVPPEGTP